MEGGLLLDVVVGERPSIFELFASEDQPLLVGGNSLFVLDFGLDILNGVRWLNVESDGLASQGLHEDLHAASQSQHQVQSRLLLDIVVRQGSSVLQLLSSKDKSLLIRWDSLLVLDLSLDILDGISGFDIKGDGLSR